MRSPTVSRPPVATRLTRSPAGTITVSAPGQNATVNASAVGFGAPVDQSAIEAPRPTCTITG